MRIIACLLLFIFATLVHHSANASSCDGEINWHGSSESSGPTNTTEFQQNLDIILNDLPSNETEISLYGEDGYHRGVGLNVAYAKARCIGQIGNDTCQDCIEKASTMIKDKCFNYAYSGFLLYGDLCMVRYSNRDFEIMEMRDKLIQITNDTTDVEPPSSTNAFNGARTKLFNALAEKAKYRPGGYRMFAMGKWYDESSNYTIYGASQCSPYLNSEKCTSCLDIVSKKLEDNFDGKVGGSIIGPSCNFQYDVKPITDDQSVAVYNLAPSSVTNSTPPGPPPSKGDGARKARLVIDILSPVIIISIIIFVVIYLFSRKTKATADEIESNFQRYDFRVITEATENFSEANMLGRGGFGAVYKGNLPNGVEIAVKRLFNKGPHGDVEFKNEATILANLQHNNLVKLRGYCLTNEERLLIYDVMVSSLDKFIFDSTKRARLTWEKLYKIVEGVARGLLYLHIDSRITVIHLDLKSANVLLDEDMIPKIADFGLSKLLTNDQTHDVISNVIGTLGYMAPEYHSRNEISPKSDVYSFGVLLIEIVSGQRIISEGVNLLISAWKNWQENTIVNLLDSALTHETNYRQMKRCIHIALLCTQHDNRLRPTMDIVVQWLTTSSIIHATPLPPYFQQIVPVPLMPLLESHDSDVSGNSSRIE